MKVVQAHHRTPQFESNLASLREHVQDGLRSAFWTQVEQLLDITPGGILLSPLRFTEQVEDDWLFHSGNTILFGLSAVVEELPEPPLYRLIGGPADGYMVRTQGQATWRVPVAPSPPSVASYTDMSVPLPRLTAIYDRQGQTGVYFYVKTERE